MGEVEITGGYVRVVVGVKLTCLWVHKCRLWSWLWKARLGEEGCRLRRTGFRASAGIFLLSNIKVLVI